MFREHDRAFTLIELLTTVAIIAILAGLLLPAISLVRQSARSSVCMSNIRQMALAFSGYSVDHEGLIPAGYMRGAAPAGGNDNWYSFLEGYLEPWNPAYFCPDGNVRKSDMAALAQPGSSTPIAGAVYTVADPWGNYPVSYKDVWHMQSYSMNWDLRRQGLRDNGTWDNFNPAAPFSNEFTYTLKPPRTSSTVLLTEIQGLQGDQNTVAGAVQYYWHGFDNDLALLRSRVQWQTGVPPAAWGHYVSNAIRAIHRKKASILFFDLHVQQIDPLEPCPNGMNAVPNGYRAQY